LTKLPSPLPGFAAEEIKRLVLIALTRMNSPRLKEVDTAAALMKVIYLNYCSELQWRVLFENANVEIVERNKGGNVDKKHATDSKISFVRMCIYFLFQFCFLNSHFLGSLLSILKMQLANAKSDILSSAKDTPIHGVMMTIRYCLQCERYAAHSLFFLSSTFHRFDANWSEILDEILAVVTDVSKTLLVYTHSITFSKYVCVQYISLFFFF
jgi:hypothetical protein